MYLRQSYVFILISMASLFKSIRSDVVFIQIMKTNKFKLRPLNRVHEGTEQLRSVGSPKQSTEQLQELLKAAFSIAHAGEDKIYDGLEARDKPLTTPIKLENDKTYDDYYLQEWIGTVCRNVVSTSFQSYLNEGMTFDQAKIYCCEEILRNISQFAQKHNVNMEFYKKIDKIMEQKVLPYLTLKYPLSEKINVNKKLNSMVKKINNFEDLDNDFIYNSDIIWEYREDGNYNDIIMRVLNEVILLADKTAENKDGEEEEETKTNYNDFDNMITQLFENVFDADWMRKKNSHDMSGSKFDKSKNRDKQNQKYREKVQQYTSYEIGRKIPESTAVFTEEEIRGKQLTIKSSQIMRIITKWCEELWEKFGNQNYYAEKLDGISMLTNKKVNKIFQYLRISLIQKFNLEKVNIENDMKEVIDNLYELEFKFIQSELSSKESPFLDRFERICGKFSAKMVENLKSCLVIYLNRLIHGLMKISDQLYSATLKTKGAWNAPPNFISFKISDLLRCRIISHEKQIIKLYQSLQDISDNNPQLLKIIRIKNRLTTGTNDLLINIRFKNSYSAEIQLKIKEKKNNESKFSKCSFNFSHFIYELHRAYFGPISEMCNVWFNLDQRSKAYLEIISKEKSNIQMNKVFNYCISNQVAHEMQNLVKFSSFICDNCGKYNSTEGFILPHQVCKTCKIYKCALCLIQDHSHSSLIEQLVTDESIKDGLIPFRCSEIPTQGVCIKIKNPNQEEPIIMFKVIKYLHKLYLFFLNPDKSITYEGELKGEKDKKRFLKDYLVYEYAGEQIKRLEQLTTQVAFQKYITCQQSKQLYHLQSEKIGHIMPNDVGKKLTVESYKKILDGPKQALKRVKKLDINLGELPSLDFIPEEMENIQEINADECKAKQLSHLSKFKKLSILEYQFNFLPEFPKVLCDLPLKKLSLNKSQFKSIPNEVQNMQSLKNLSFKTNKFGLFPPPILKLTNLEVLNLQECNLCIIPPQINKLINLKILIIQVNKLKTLPKQIQKLQNLEWFDFGLNDLTELTIDYSKLKKLKRTRLAWNQFSKAPEIHNQSLIKIDFAKHKKFTQGDLSSWRLDQILQINLSESGLKVLKNLQGIANVNNLLLNNNQLENLPNQFCKLTKLKKLNLIENKLQTLPQNINQLLNIKKLYLSKNANIQIPSSFADLKLQQLQMNSCALKEFPQAVTGLKFLNILDIGNNQLTCLPSEFNKLIDLEVFIFDMNKIYALPDDILKLKKIRKIAFRQKEAYSSDDFLVKILKLSQTEINCSGSKIEILPESIPLNQHIEKMNFSNNSIQVIPSSIVNVENIKQLDFSKNKLKELNTAVFRLKKLESLNLSENELESLPNYFDLLTKLKSLNVSKNKLTTLPDTLQVLISRNFSLKIQDNPIETYPLWFIGLQFQNQLLSLKGLKSGELPKLYPGQSYKKIVLDNSTIDDVPREVYHLKKTESLSMKNCGLKNFPNKIKELPKIKQLNLSDNCIEQISSLGGYEELKLDIANNPIKKISKEFSTIKKLTVRFNPSILVDLKENSCLQYFKPVEALCDNFQLTEVPQQFQELTTTTKIDLSKNSLSKFPDCILNLKQLKQINISEQYIGSLPQNIKCFSSLSKLYANNCGLKALPSSLSQLTNMNELQVSNNQIAELPSLQKMTNLTVLKANRNSIKVFPNYILMLTKCKQIYLDDNQISEVPPQVVNYDIMLSLKNNLIELPVFLPYGSKMKKEKFILEGNPINKNHPSLFTEIPAVQNPSCSKCDSPLTYPYYWLKWEQGTKFGCTKCIEAPSTQEGKNFAYESNSVLLMGKWDKVLTRMLGTNIQPADRVKAHAQKKAYNCNGPQDVDHMLVKSPRYSCLVCLADPCEVLPGSYFDFCHACLQRSKTGDTKIKEIYEKANHSPEHPWIRILYTPDRIYYTW